MTSRQRRQKPELPHEHLARQAKFAKPQYRDAAGESDTRGLPLRKIHPERDPHFKHWLRFKTCKVYGLIDSLTEQVHVCWSEEFTPSTASGFKSDPAHTGKAYSGRLKRSDIPSASSTGCLSLCRHAHRMQEPNPDEFDRRFGINRHELARQQHREYLAEKERSR